MRRLILSWALAAAAVGLSGCGFTPLYATPGLSSNLSAIEIVASEGRAGELLREKLGDSLARDPATPARYTLRTMLGEARYPRGARIDNVANRYELRLVADWHLIDKATGAEIKAGRAESTLSYASADQPYAGVAAQLDAQDRAAGEVAKKIRLAIAAWMARPKP